MTAKTYKKVERKPSHAGRILKSGFIDEYNLDITTVAKLLGISRVHLSRIINGHSPITSDIAIRLEVLTKTPASQWLTIQAKYDTYLMEQKEDFQQYKKSLSKLNHYFENAINSSKKEQRINQETRELVASTAILAKQIRANF